MTIDVLTIFPELIDQALAFSIPGRAQKSGTVAVTAHQLRQFGVDKHGNIDDTPYGGGPGMILRVDVADRALSAVDPDRQACRVMLSPDGTLLNQTLVKTLASHTHLVLLSGRYEGFDARIERLVDQKISIGPYVVSGGELPALVVIDALVRLQPGVLGNAASLTDETFEGELTDFPQYTRPDSYNGQAVPTVLKSGHHAEIMAWRRAHQRLADGSAH